MIQLLATVTLGARVARIFPTKLEKLRIELENLANEEDGLKAIGDAMRMSHVETLDLRANSITPKSLLGFVAAATPSRAFKHLVLKNNDLVGTKADFQYPDLAALQRLGIYVADSKIEKFTMSLINGAKLTVEKGAPILDLTVGLPPAPLAEAEVLTPVDMLILAEIFKFGLLTAKLVILDGSPVTGSNNVPGSAAQEIDTDVVGFRAFCDGLKGSCVSELMLRGCSLGASALSILTEGLPSMSTMQILNLSDNHGIGDLNELTVDNLFQSSLTELDISSVGMTPDGIGRLANFFKKRTRICDTLNRLTVSSTGDMQKQEVYTLEDLQHGGERATNVVLQSKCLGSADLELLAALLTSINSWQVHVEILNIADNPIGIPIGGTAEVPLYSGTKAFGAALAVCYKKGHLRRIIFGQEQQHTCECNLEPQTQTLDFANVKIGPPEAELIASIIDILKPSFKSLILSSTGNTKLKILSQKFTLSKEMEVLDLPSKGLKSVDLQVLTKFLYGISTNGSPFGQNLQVH
jgi:hypothetical protein